MMSKTTCEDEGLLNHIIKIKKHTSTRNLTQEELHLWIHFFYLCFNNNIYLPSKADNALVTPLLGMSMGSADCFQLSDLSAGLLLNNYIMKIAETIILWCSTLSTNLFNVYWNRNESARSDWPVRMNQPIGSPNAVSFRFR